MPLTEEEKANKAAAEKAKAEIGNKPAEAQAQESETEKALRLKVEELQKQLADAQKSQPPLPPVPPGATTDEPEEKKTYTVNAPPEGSTAWTYARQHYTQGQKVELDSALAKELATAKIIDLKS